MLGLAPRLAHKLTDNSSLARCKTQNFAARFIRLTGHCFFWTGYAQVFNKGRVAMPNAEVARIKPDAEGLTWAAAVATETPGFSLLYFRPDVFSLKRNSRLLCST